MHASLMDVLYLDNLLIRERNGVGFDGSRPVAYAPAAVPNERFHVMPRAMPITLINEIIEGFELSASHLSQAGLDGVELVASHGYLLGQFLNPKINLRTDKFGGTFEGRLRFLKDAIQATRAVLVRK